MDKVFTDVNPLLKKEDWVLAIKIKENINLFNKYPKIAFRENPIEGIEDKLKKQILELNGKTETSGEKFALSVLQ